MNLNNTSKATAALNQVSDWHAANCGIAILLALAAEREDGPARPELKLLANMCRESFEELEAILKTLMGELSQKEPGPESLT